MAPGNSDARCMQSSPRDLGEPASVLIKLLLGGSLVAGLVLLIWGPLLVVSLVNQTGVPNNPVGASMQLSLGGQQLLEITVQEQYITALSDEEYYNISQLVDSKTVSQAALLVCAQWVPFGCLVLLDFVLT